MFLYFFKLRTMLIDIKRVCRYDIDIQFEILIISIQFIYFKSKIKTLTKGENCKYKIHNL